MGIFLFPGFSQLLARHCVHASGALVLYPFSPVIGRLVSALLEHSHYHPPRLASVLFPPCALCSLDPGTLLMSPFPTSNLAVCYCGVSCCSAHHCLCAVTPWEGAVVLSKAALFIYGASRAYLTSDGSAACTPDTVKRGQSLPGSCDLLQVFSEISQLLQCPPTILPTA